MKRVITLFLMFFVLIGKSETAADSIKIKKNLLKLDSVLVHKSIQDKKAKEFIEKECLLDSLFCGQIVRGQYKSYKYNDEWTMDLVGYSFKGSKLENDSESFFILTIYRNKDQWYTKIFSDLMGEIQVNLYGLEDDKHNEQIKVWGYSYPYFDSEYGKFELTITNGIGSCNYEFSK
ncbi:hypothetical protein [Pseudofulvibacter geojedonensis]|uniref:Uncharacterized protein n=1 Tax=Pseudofulvibacter geojedonensis TaxID=1123758 RepID=A0ABW3HZZ9_9FLAO